MIQVIHECKLQNVLYFMMLPSSILAQQLNTEAFLSAVISHMHSSNNYDSL